MLETPNTQASPSQDGQRHTATMPPRLGIIGGGQLAKMLAMAGFQLGCDIVVLERNNESPAMRIATQAIVGDWDDPAVLLQLASQVDVVTLENEFVNAAGLARLEQAGYAIFPRAMTLQLIQDKLLQKQTLQQAGIAVPRFCAVASPADIASAAATLGWPLVLKTRRHGYDGKGNMTIHSAAEIAAAWEGLGGGKRPLFVEAFCPFVAELAVMMTRGRDGYIAAYPLVESVQRDHICHIVKAPANVSEEIRERALAMARRAILTVDGVGSFGVEMFLQADGAVLLNELAPRVHNSGHYTIEACSCSQFENHLRAVLGWPLGATTMVAPAAVMVNLLGAGPGAGPPHGIETALAVPGVHLHIYGKAVASRGRKMGHVTALGATMEEAFMTAQRAAAAVRFGTTR